MFTDRRDYLIAMTQQLMERVVDSQRLSPRDLEAIVGLAPGG